MSDRSDIVTLGYLVSLYRVVLLELETSGRWNTLVCVYSSTFDLLRSAGCGVWLEVGLPVTEQGQDVVGLAAEFLRKSCFQEVHVSAGCIIRDAHLLVDKRLSGMMLRSRNTTKVLKVKHHWRCLMVSWVS